MKKYTSAAALALRLTVRPVALLFCLAGFCQWWHLFRMGMNGIYDDVFEYILDDFPAFVGNFGMLLLAGVLYFTLAGGKGSKTAYTLRRLRLSEGAETAVFSLVFAGYFVLYWAFQIGMMLLLYTMYDRTIGAPENLLFVSAFRSSYFHSVLPLYEPWALVRNAVLCLTFGSFAALGAQNARNGRSFPLCMFFVVVIWWIILYPHEMASQTNDISLSIIALVCLGIDIFWTWRWMRNEAN